VLEKYFTAPTTSIFMVVCQLLEACFVHHVVTSDCKEEEIQLTGLGKGNLNLYLIAYFKLIYEFPELRENIFVFECPGLWAVEVTWIVSPL